MTFAWANWCLALKHKTLASEIMNVNGKQNLDARFLRSQDGSYSRLHGCRAISHHAHWKGRRVTWLWMTCHASGVAFLKNCGWWLISGPSLTTHQNPTSPTWMGALIHGNFWKDHAETRSEEHKGMGGRRSSGVTSWPEAPRIHLMCQHQVVRAGRRTGISYEVVFSFEV
jgi:hypothetical protein